LATKRRKAKRKSPDNISRGEKRDTCFVISPFGGWNDRYYSEVYSPAVEDAGLEPHRADDIYRPSAIVHDIWAYVTKSRVILAEFTGKNPNVFYELGLAHAVGKPVVMITQSMEDVPFDLRSLRVLQYEIRDPEWSAVLRAKISSALKEVLAAPESAVLPSFLKVQRAQRTPTVTPLEKRLLQLQQQVELLTVQSRTASVHSPERAIGPDEAEALIRKYVLTGMSDHGIIERIIRRGVPQSWALKTLARIKVESATEKRPTGEKQDEQKVAAPSPEKPEPA
jgi:hypothetical protein